VSQVPISDGDGAYWNEVRDGGKDEEREVRQARQERERQTWADMQPDTAIEEVDNGN